MNIETYSFYGKALSDQISKGDGAGVDLNFRNSGVVIDKNQNSYFAVNGVHPVIQGNYNSYYPKSIVEASLDTDEIINSYPFSSLLNHDIDMEALTFINNEASTIYVGDEYNYIYEIKLESGSAKLLREWNLKSIDITTNIDKGIEAMTYSEGFFYVGIQEEKKIYKLNLNLSEENPVVNLESFFDLEVSPSGLFAHSDGTLYVVSITANEQKIFRYLTDGTLICELMIPDSLNIVRPDGIFIDDSDYVYIADSQGPIYDGHSLYKIKWQDQCN